jgi:hypothetical protein
MFEVLLVSVNGPTGTSPVVHRHRLSHGRSHFLGDQTGHNIGAATRRKRHDHFDGSGWVGLRLYKPMHSQHAKQHCKLGVCPQSSMKYIHVCPCKNCFLLGLPATPLPARHLAD